MVPLLIETSVRVSMPEPSVSPPGTEHAPSRNNDTFESHLRDSGSPANATPAARNEEPAAGSQDETSEVNSTPEETETPVPEMNDVAEAVAAAAALAIAAIPTETTTPPLATESETAVPVATINLEVAAPEAETGSPLPQSLSEPVADVLESMPADAATTVADEPATRDPAQQRDGPALARGAPAGGEPKTESPMRVADAVRPERRTLDRESASQAAQTPAEVVVTAEAPETQEKRPAADLGKAATMSAERRTARPVTESSAIAAAEPTPAKNEHEPQKVQPDVRFDSQAGEVDKPAEASHARFGQHLLQRGAERTEAGPRLSEADESRLIDRVARAVRYAENRDGLVRLRLSPPELGSLRLELRVQAGVMTARLEAETNGARSLLMDNLPVLRDRLAEQGIRIEQFEVDLRQRQGQGGDFSGTWDQAERRDPPEPSTPEPERRPSAPDTSKQPSEPRPIVSKNPRGLDVVV